MDNHSSKMVAMYGDNTLHFREIIFILRRKSTLKLVCSSFLVDRIHEFVKHL